MRYIQIEDILYEIYNEETENDECKSDCALCNNRCELGLHAMSQTTTGVGA